MVHSLQQLVRRAAWLEPQGPLPGGDGLLLRSPPSLPVVLHGAGVVKVAILGAGAMGSVFGGHLALAGHDVTLVDVWREHMEAVAANGLDLRTPDGTSVIVPLTAIYDPSLLEPVELVIVLTKTFAGAEALRSIQHALTD